MNFARSSVGGRLLNLKRSTNWSKPFLADLINDSGGDPKSDGYRNETIPTENL
jgi:hypothetical protein